MCNEIQRQFFKLVNNIRWTLSIIWDILVSFTRILEVSLRLSSGGCFVQNWHLSEVDYFKVTGDAKDGTMDLLNTKLVLQIAKQFSYIFFWVIPRILNFICRRFGTLCLFRLHTRVGMKNGPMARSIFEPNLFPCKYPNILYPVILHTYPRMKTEQSVPKRRHIKFRTRGITQKKAYNIQNKKKVWNQEKPNNYCSSNRHY